MSRRQRPAAAAVDAVVGQYYESPEPSAEPLSTRDLNWREVRDALWLAKSLAPDSSPRPPAADPATTPVTARPDENAVPADEPEPEPATDLQPPQPGQFKEAEKWPLGPAQRAHTTTVEAGTTQETAPLAWPSAPALPEARLIARALRPFNKSSPSPWRRELDEEATADRAARDKMWIPQWRPAAWHRFELMLVIDTSASMEIWSHTVSQFRAVLEQQGAFRGVRTCFLDCSQPDEDKLTLRSEGPAGTARHWRDLVDTTGRRVVLVLTDAIGDAWRSGAAARMVAKWAGAMPVAVVQTLPQRLWHWSGLSPHRMKLRSPRPASANAELRVETPNRMPANAVAVPVLALEPEWFASWSALVTGRKIGWIETTAVVAQPDGTVETAGESEPAEPTARDKVTRFRTIASVPAFQLAGLLAAAPLNIPTMKLVQRLLLPSAGLSALAEILLGGLLRRASDTSATDPVAVAYEFHDGVREELLSGERRDNTVRVARIIGDYGKGSAVLRNFREALSDPDGTELPEPSEENVPHLRVQEAVFRALSGRYSQRGRRLRHKLKSRSEPVAGGPEVPGARVPDHSGSIHEEGPLTTTDLPPVPVDDDSPGQQGGDVTTSDISTRTEGRRVTNQPRIWGQIPLRNPDFVGRGELLEQLRKRLMTPGATAVLPEALHGMGGVGKSQTVVEYIYQHVGEYDVVWWIPAEHSAQIRTSFVDLAKQLDLPASGSADTAVPAVLEALRKGEPYSRWLLVFDNADRPDVVSPFFPAGAGHIVVTSRNSQWAGVARTVEVDLFTREESKELLRRRGGELSDDEADQLAEALGDLPLAIEQAASWRAQTGMQASEYVALLEENRTELLETGAPPDYQLPVAAAWNVPLARLRTEHPAALQLLQLCAFFGPEPISRTVFTGARDAPVPDALREAFGDPIKLNRAIREISRYSLAKIDYRDNTLQLHRLVQAVLKNQLHEPEHGEMRHSVHLLLTNGDPGDPENTTTWRRYAELLPHTNASRAMWCGNPWVKQLVTNLVRYLINSGDFHGAGDQAQQVLNAWRENLGEDSPETLNMARLYAVALQTLGHTKEAQALNAQIYERLRQTVDEDDESLLRIGDAIAGDFRSQGLFAEEVRAQQEVYDRAVRILGEDDPETLRLATNLASSLRLMGRFFDARDLDEETARRRTYTLGENHAATLRSFNALAIDQRECGHYVEAAVLQRDTLAKQREILGDNHPGTLGALRNLAVATRKAGGHDEAQLLSEDCLDRYRRRSGEDHIDTVTATMGLSIDYRHANALARSKELAERSYRAFGEIRGGRHPFTLISGTNLAITLRLATELDAAHELNEFVAKELLDNLGGDHPYTLTAMTNLASDLAALGRVAEACELDRDSLARSDRVLGSEHPSTLAVALNLSLDLNQLGQGDEAAILHTKTTNSFRQVLGADHPATLAAARMVRADCDSDTMQL
ncbi:MAG TPA: FxSxx-COOH system tetratricopeptide repeat protein [Amycolatopsis sp.]|uniref:FxSxx-COOH system tetratricopeptide repeat protein n=1 Tax=Amycolatopsis sp. TaxID=37632 RepID=UPI002B4938AF|nr:FxSxx-COOH system tetratricopeptide repeat protein [Amycolatopsis sp.]HKS47758.1 FxSxx-COOH system tetratricopeptide repeat protein [Amycolatopsis sp.]